MLRDGALAFDGEVILSQELKKRYFELIDGDKRFEEYVPMKFIFFPLLSSLHG